jgi:hypothetical protein
MSATATSSTAPNVEAATSSSTPPEKAESEPTIIIVPDAPVAPPHPLDDLVMGYPKIAGRMGLIPETAMFRRFGALNARNLLYLQSDLVHIENKLKSLEWEDSRSTGKREKYATDHYWIKRDGDVRQRELVMKMRDTLHQYSMNGIDHT